MALRPRYFEVGALVWYDTDLAKVLYCGLTHMVIELLKEPMQIEIPFNDRNTAVRLATKAEAILYGR